MRLQANKMIIVHEESQNEIGAHGTKVAFAAGRESDKTPVKLVMNNQTILVDEPTMDLSDDEDREGDTTDDFDEAMPRKTIMHMIRRRTQHVAPNMENGGAGGKRESVMDKINF